MEVQDPYQTDARLWCAPVHPGHADVLLAALHPDHPFVLIETWDGIGDWHKATVRIGADDEPRPRLVRKHSFDLLVSPAEAAEIGSLLRAQGMSGGGFRCHQFQRHPKATFHVPDSLQASAGAQRGQGVELSIELPHDGEPALVSSPNRANLDAFLARLA